MAVVQIQISPQRKKNVGSRLPFPFGEIGWAIDTRELSNGSVIRFQ